MPSRMSEFDALLLGDLDGRGEYGGLTLDNEAGWRLCVRVGVVIRGIFREQMGMDEGVLADVDRFAVLSLII